ncbi:hypothetical protein F53441_8514 [Fusarium austroafricanum]|uniref:Cytochrome P450 monooxygenase n=1 Tax=Fusarium austroafricanum TaxID=2364996 RepID=A0A8H4KE07_9HYPO|nr:hypothetical protein F53441_8514 [Fusarium austroafricanum]
MFHERLTLILLFLLGVVMVRWILRHGADKGLPPGPVPLPILGNILDIAPKNSIEFEHWIKHKDQYGPVSSVTVMGKTMILIHDLEASHQILEKMASKTSGRPRMNFAHGLCGFGRDISNQQCNNDHHLQRKLVHQELGTAAKSAQYDVFQQEVFEHVEIGSAEAAREVPFALSKEQMKHGSKVSSYVSRLLEQLSEKGDSDERIDFDEETVKWTAGVMYTAGSHTTVTSLKWFLLAMVMYPDVQKEAQEEIAKVTRGKRLPQMDDRKNLPFLEGLVKETYRWNPVGPMSLPHAATSDVEYKGYNIPKGSIILPSVWWFCHDPEVYQNPIEFDPDRYLEPRF